MNTSILFDHELVADGGFFARLVLQIEGSRAADIRRSVPRQDGLPVSPARLAARNVQVAVRPGRDAEFIQMTHPFDSVGAGRLLTIMVGDVYSTDRIRIRMDALVGAGHGPRAEVDVGQIVVLAHLDRSDGGVHLRTVNLPIRLSAANGGRVLADIGTMPIARDAGAERFHLRPGPRRDDQSPPQCA